MVISTGADRARWAGHIRLAVLALVGVLAAHTTIYVAQYGAGDRFADAMARGGHDGWWLPASIVILGGGLLVLLHVLGSLNRLERRLRATERAAVEGGSLPGLPFRREALAIWRRLLPLVGVLFVLQENIEHLVSQGHLPGLEVLGGAEYPLAIPALLLLTAALSVLGALVRWRILVLRTRIEAAEARTTYRLVDDVSAPRWRVVGNLAPRIWMSVRLDAGRAPPSVLRP